jgi:hypothetical protein
MRKIQSVSTCCGLCSIADDQSELGLQLHQRIRLINCIRESVRSSLIPHKSSPDGSFQPLTPEAIENLTGSESFLTSDDYLIPVIEDDPLLRAYTLSPRLSHHVQIQQNRRRTTGQTKKTFSAVMNNPHVPPIYPPSFVESSSSKEARSVSSGHG